MDGDIAPLPRARRRCARHDALLVVDDAHGFGVLGASGRRRARALRPPARDVPPLVGTLGKAVGGFGAFVAGDADLIETLVQRARTYIYTTALPLAVAAARGPRSRCSRRGLAARARPRARAAFPAARRPRPACRSRPPKRRSSPCCSAARTTPSRRAAGCSSAAYFVAAIRPPTVPAGTSRLRVALSAAHRDADVDGLVAALADVIPRA